ncbi:molybdopterin-dependent oxidoreductase [Curvibacter sp. RS43]|uniref:Molybdopterin-dependent oxidoreductase n=1 Tax=Curvibacter microcysteis TaxID=3026419 RepID=A0ABT5MHS2_9BURK|nr:MULTISPECIES: molybdopterin-dependent oxidoreductase [unclassified Curvibacter]MDD0810900.1 molybdopterin-dependent oxidoreductase [Curvibacter sp. RS43]MDD0816144.1 molybdopterin-dependent oxidoreductase [Curvibacter sp. HBC28]
MKKRHFLSLAGAAGALLPTLPSQAQAASDEPVLLTVSGAVGKPNRGPLDKVIDQMMGKHGIEFSQATTFTASALAALPAVSIQPALEYDNKPHQLSGPLLTTVLQAAGVVLTPTRHIELRAVDGYNVALSVADIQARQMMVATRIDGRPMALGGLGPLWAVFDPAKLPALKGKPASEGFAKAPWGLYHIGVKAA